MTDATTLPAMTSSRPYLIRAIYQWIVDNGMTPHLLVATDNDRVQVPRQFTKDGGIVLNVAPEAVRSLEMGNDLVSFSARFGGAPINIRLPVEHIQAIYVRENGQGMAFAEETKPVPTSKDLTEAAPETTEDTPAKPTRPHLRVIK